jgi:hypothetical protein
VAFIKEAIEEYLLKRKRNKFLSKLNQVSVTPFKQLHAQDYVSFSHIGLNGDIIYSIPAMLSIAQGKKIRLYLDVNQKTMYTSKMKHFNKDKILTPNSVEFIKPLILNNPQFEICKIWEKEIIDYDLNEFRKYPFDYRMGHICRWYFLAFGITYNLSNPWLKVTPNITFKNDIIIARSFRYRTLGINYKFLSKYKNLKFVGLLEEFEDMKTQIHNVEYIKVSNALEMAEIIAGCKYFIGNQSFPFSIAEALKVKRVLEVSNENPNVIVDGDDGFDFCFQQQFEKIISELEK